MTSYVHSRYEKVLDENICARGKVMKGFDNYDAELVLARKLL
jgi:hypothetical protein